MKIVILAIFFFLALCQFSSVANAYCYSDQWECDSGQCINEDYRCDGDDDCYDGSDEDGCGTVNLGLAIGLSIFFFILFCVVCPIAICVLIWCCVAGALGTAFRSNRTTTTTVATGAPAQQSTVVVASTAQQSTQGKGDYPPSYPVAQPGYAHQPPPSYPVAQPGYAPQPATFPAQQAAYPPQQAGYQPPPAGYPPQ